MKTEENWLKFIISGRVDDYLKFVNSRRAEEINGGGRSTLYNRCAGDKRNEYR